MKRPSTMHLLAPGLAALLLTVTCIATAPVGLQRDVVFTGQAPLARNDELLRRLLSPLNARRIEQQIPRGAGTLHAWPLDPAQQHFALYVPPPSNTAAGYALLVFVPPWEDARVPVQWIPVLDREHTIFVTAAGSGNDADVSTRREPLAVLAAYNVMQRYHVDPARVYVGGFSGGSRIALRLALGYPDLFRGALLDAGSDPIGTAQVPLPPGDLLHRFQQSSRIVFLTGSDDLIRQAQLARANASLQQWCKFDADSITLLHVDHTLADAAAFANGLNALFTPGTPDVARIEACRSRNGAAMESEIDHAESLARAGRFDQAAQAIAAIDARYGGLAAPRSTRLMDTIDLHRAKSH